MPNELIVYKVATLVEKEDPILKTVYQTYISPVMGFEYSGGELSNFWNLVSRDNIPLVGQPGKSTSYYPGFHSFVQKTSAVRILHNFLFDNVSPLTSGEFQDVVLLTCGVLKEWITAIGIELDNELTVVSNRIIVPSYPLTDIRDDKNCDWFFEAQSKTRQADTHTKNVINWAQPKEKTAAIYRQNRKHNNMREKLR